MIRHRLVPILSSFGLPAYFSLAFVISWSCWLPAALSGEDIGAAWIQGLVYAGIAGPAIAGIGLLYLTGDRAQRMDFWERVYQVGRLRPRWFAAVVLIYPLLTALGAGLDWTLSGHRPDAGILMQLLSNPGTLFAYLILVLLLGPVPEELGWRGYALDRLQARWTAFGSSLLLGVAWAAWHLPLFFVKGSYQNGLGFGTLAFWLFNLTAIASSVLITWVYNKNERSIFSAIFLHGVLNLTRAVMTLSEAAEVARTLLLTALASGIVIYWGINGRAKPIESRARCPGRGAERQGAGGSESP
jgi:membrane protease YdiL (CAAX protease family)